MQDLSLDTEFVSPEAPRIQCIFIENDESCIAPQSFSTRILSFTCLDQRLFTIDIKNPSGFKLCKWNAKISTGKSRSEHALSISRKIGKNPEIYRKGPGATQLAHDVIPTLVKRCMYVRS